NWGVLTADGAADGDDEGEDGGAGEVVSVSRSALPATSVAQPAAAPVTSIAAAAPMTARVRVIGASAMSTATGSQPPIVGRVVGLLRRPGPRQRARRRRWRPPRASTQRCSVRRTACVHVLRPTSALLAAS